MTNKKVTRRALLMSVTSLLICISMLLGTTFAWFTDEVTSGVNKIVAGNLDVELQHSTDGTNFSNVTATTTDLFKTATSGILWEPGAMAIETFKVINKGSLALKYQFALNKLTDNDYNTVTWANKTSDTHDLREVIKVAVTETRPGTREAAAALTYVSWDEFVSGAAFTGHLDTTNAEQVFTVVLYWKDNENAVDNKLNLKNGVYNADSNPNGYTLNNPTKNSGATQLYLDASIKLLATQYTVENDSFDNQYDASADGVNTYDLAVNINSTTGVSVGSGTITETNDVYTAPVATAIADTIITDSTATSTIPKGTTATLTVGNTTINTGIDKLTDLTRKIETTENTSGSVTYDISYKATVTTTTTGDNSATTTAEYEVHTFSDIVTNVLDIGTGLANVTVKHGNTEMNKLDAAGVPASPNADGDFYYDSVAGKLYIYSKTYSPYTISWTLPDVSVTVDNTVTKMTLADFRDGVNDGTYANASVTLLRNVDLGGAEWTPIGTKDHPFSGVFDGNGKTISNFRLSGSGENNPIALFGYIKGTASSFTSTTALSEFYNNSYDVTLPDEDVFGCEVKNLTVSGVTANTTADGWTAAAVSYCENATVKNVTVTNSTITANEKVGGVVAFVPNNAAAFIDGCQTTSTVTVTASTKNHAAGILGRVYSNLSRVIISNSENNATISCAGVNGAGIAGQAKSTLFYNCTNNGNVTGGTNTAGITTNSDGSVIIGCTNNGTIKSTGDATASDKCTAGIASCLLNNGAVVVNCTNNGSVTANCTDKAVVCGIAYCDQVNSSTVLNCVNTGILTNTAADGKVYPISNVYGVMKQVAPNNLAELNTKLGEGDKNVEVTNNLTLTDDDCTITPVTQEFVTFDNSPTHLTIDLSSITTTSLQVNVSNATISVVGNYDKSNFTLNIVGSGNNITYADSDLNLKYLYVTNDSSSKSEVTVSAAVDSLVLAGSGTVEATVNANTMIGRVRFATAGGKYTLTNYGTISHDDGGTGNQHTVSTIVACTITVNNHGTIAAIGNSYALLFYNGCNVTVNEYSGSSCTSDKMWSKCATSNGATVTFNPINN